MGSPKETWDKHGAKLKLVLAVIGIAWTLFSSITVTMWAVTDKTLFWEAIDVASIQRVDLLEHNSVKSDSLLNQLITEVRMINNGRIVDRWVQIVDSPRFTEEEKEAIKDGVFVRKTISADSLSTILRDK